MSPSPLGQHNLLNSRIRQEHAQRNLYASANQRIRDFLEKQKKEVLRQKKVLEFQRYKREQAKEKFEQRV